MPSWQCSLDKVIGSKNRDVGLNSYLLDVRGACVYEVCPAGSDTNGIPYLMQRICGIFSRSVASATAATL